jgi:hypothetical protein
MNTKKSPKIILALFFILGFSFLFSSGFSLAFDSGWIAPASSYGVCGGNSPDCGPAPWYGTSWSLPSNGHPSGSYTYLSDSNQGVNLFNGGAVGKLISIPSSGNYYVSINAGFDDGSNSEILYVGVNDWGSSFYARQAMDFSSSIKCVYKNKFNIDSPQAKVWAQTANPSGSVHLKEFKLADCLPSDVNIYCDDGTLIPANLLRCGQTILCSFSTDCGINSFVGSSFCSGNNLFRNFISYTCNNPGTANSYCSSSTSSQIFQSCSDYCNVLTNTCDTFICHNNLECNDNNVSTIDTCLNPNTTQSSCVHTIINPTIPVITLFSPQNMTYVLNQTNLILPLNASSTQAVYWNYTLNGNFFAVAGFSSNLLTNLNVINGSNTLIVSGNNANGSDFRSIIFNVLISAINNSNNNTNSTNSTNSTIPLIYLHSPLNQIYNSTPVLINATSNQYVNWGYSLNGINFSGINNSLSFNFNLTNLLNATYNLIVYGRNANGTGNNSVSFVFNSSSNGSGNNTNNTNQTTALWINVTYPLNGFTYNTTYILLNATSNQTVSWSYNLNNGTNISFVPGNFYNFSLLNGTNILIVYGNNSNGTGLQIINFNYNQSSNQNGICVPNWVLGSWGSCDDGERIRSYFDSDNCNNNTGKPADIQANCGGNDDNNGGNSSIIIRSGGSGRNITEIASGNYTLDLSNKNKTDGFSIKFIYWLIFVLIILIIAILLILLFYFL